MRLKDIPNLICVLRILLVPPVVYFILNESHLLAFYLFIIAGLSDGIDGFLAKHFKWQSRLGSILDPIADKLLLVSTYLSIGYVGLVPYWLVVAVFVRDILIVTGGYCYHRLVGKFQMAPSLISKINTVTQILLIATVLSVEMTRIPQHVIDYMVLFTLCTIVLSGLDYVMVWGRKALRSKERLSKHD